MLATGKTWKTRKPRETSNLNMDVNKSCQHSTLHLENMEQLICKTRSFTLETKTYKLLW